MASFKQRVRLPRKAKQIKQKWPTPVKVSQIQSMTRCTRKSQRLLKHPHAIWAVTEIAEQILSELPMKDLLFCQRVCSTWHQLISSSHKLQKALFLRPDSSMTGSSRAINPMLAEEFKQMFQMSHRVAWMDWARTARQPAFLYERASWRRMFITQPPFTTFRQVRHSHPTGYSYRYRSNHVGTCRTPNGIRMGYLYDVTESELREYKAKQSRYIFIWGGSRFLTLKRRLKGPRGSMSPEGGEDTLTMSIVTDCYSRWGRRGPNSPLALPDPMDEFESQGKETVELEFEWETHKCTTHCW